jgi:hypothetical protein
LKTRLTNYFKPEMFHPESKSPPANEGKTGQ